MNESLDQLYERMLIARCQAGDEAAFAEIVGRYQPRLRYFLRKISGESVVDDLLQEVWLDVFRSIRRLNDSGAFTAWVYQIARNHAYRHLRRTKKLVSMDAVVDVAAPDERPDEEFAADEPQLVHECLDELTPQHREVLVLRFLEGMSYDQIASVAGCSVGTVRSRLHYGKLALRTAINRRRQT